MSKLSTEFSFCIWLARNNAVCQSVELNSPLANTTPLESRSPLIPKAKIKSNLSNSLTLSKSPVVSINKGNTCHGNSILQALRTSKGSAQTSPLLKSVTVNMAIKEKSIVPTDPSDFLTTLKHKILSTGCACLLFLILPRSRILQKF